MNSNEINTERRQNSNLVQVSNNNAKYYVQLAAQRAEDADKSVADCANYLSAAQRCITECQNVKDSMELSLSDMIAIHEMRVDNPHNINANQIDAYTKAEVDALVSATQSDYYTASEVDSQLLNKAPNNLVGTPFAEGGYYITRINNGTEWSRAYYSNPEKTNLVWLEQGGFYITTKVLDAGQGDFVHIPLPIPYNHGYYARNIALSEPGISYALPDSCYVDSGTYLNIMLKNLDSQSIVLTGIWWQTAGLPVGSGGGRDYGQGGRS